MDIIRFLDNEFFVSIKSMIDAVYYDENIAYCNLVGASKNYFSKPKNYCNQAFLLYSIEEELAKRKEGGMLEIKEKLLHFAKKVCNAYL